LVLKALAPWVQVFAVLIRRRCYPEAMLMQMRAQQQQQAQFMQPAGAPAPAAGPAPQQGPQQQVAPLQVAGA
jgi:hypothetical protein